MVCIELFGSKHQNFPVNFDLFDLRTIKQTSPSLLLLNNHITDCTGFNVGEACTNYGEIVEKVSIPNNQDMHSDKYGYKSCGADDEKRGECTKETKKPKEQV